MLPPVACPTAVVTYEGLVHTDSGGGYALLQKLTVARAQAAAPAHGSDTAPDRRLRWAECYLSLLRRFLQEDAELAAQLQQAHPGAFLWTSALTCGSGATATDTGLHAGCSLLEEQAMVTHLYAALLQEEAHRQACALLPGASSCCWQGLGLTGASLSHPLTSSGIYGGASNGHAAGSKEDPGVKARPKPKPLQRLRSLLSFRDRRRPAVGPEQPSSPASPAAPFPCSPGPSPASTPRSLASPRALDPAASTEESSSPTSSRISSSGALGEAEASAHVAALYRRAAGAYQHIASQLLPAAQAARAAREAQEAQAAREAQEAQPVAESGGVAPAADGQEAGPAEQAPGCGPVELWPGCAECLAQLCLAQAQGVVALRAAARGGSPLLAAALHRGAAEMFEAAVQAAAGIRPSAPAAGCAISDRLGRFLSASAHSQWAAAWRQAALHEQAESQAGAAVACMRAAISVGMRAIEAADDQGWCAALQADLARMERLLGWLDRERSVVYYQPVAPVAPDLPPGRVIVAATAHELPACEQAEEGLLV